MFLWYPVLARAPRRTARNKGSGYENELEIEAIYKLSSIDNRGHLVQEPLVSSIFSPLKLAE
jgi:hypothetical protein